MQGGRDIIPAMNPAAPEVVILKASAGSGKTYRLSLRYLASAFASGLAPGGRAGESRSDFPSLQSLLAVTFTKNAAREMKERILGWLKEAGLGDAKRIAELAGPLGISPKDLPRRARNAVEHILADYSDFRVETIDSFMTAVFKTSAVDLGFPPDFEIVLEPDELIDYVFSLYLRDVRAETGEGELFRTILDYLNQYPKGDASFAWDPTAKILGRLVDFHRRLTARTGRVVIAKLDQERGLLIPRIIKAARDLEEAIGASGLAANAKSAWYSKIRRAVAEDRLSDLVDVSFKTIPVKKSFLPAYTAVEHDWRALEGLVRKYGSLYARDFFTPYLQAYLSLANTLDRVKRRQGIVFIEDMNRQLARYIESELVPDIYFRLGERIRHFLIDEFQDTSPIQWRNLRPLIDESLSQGGSLFAVGDTKQAIFGFRDADYRIMKSLEDGRDGFPSAELKVEELKENWRSGQAILDFVKAVFLRQEEPAEGDEEDEQDEYARIAALSGLSRFEQNVIPSHRGKGYVEVALLNKNWGDASIDAEGSTAAEQGPDEGADADFSDGPERLKIQSLVADLHARGYAYADMAVLTYKNKSVVQVSSWLNEKNIPFIPYSSLDIRGRKVIGEILALLRFLDSPPDDLAFASFLLGDVFGQALAHAFGRSEDWKPFLFNCRVGRASPLYVVFREHRPDLWDRFFEPLFRTTGYYPLYDLVTAVYRAFGVFARFPGEEAALARLLEAIKSFEGEGRNDLREFLALSADGESGEAWKIDVPAEIDAVRVMTIHKAKGLGFRVVILLLYGDRSRPPDFYIESSGGEEGESEVHVYKITKGLAANDDELKRVYEETGTREAVNRLNTLYVALTRAEAEMYVVGVKGKGDKFPFDLIDVPDPVGGEPLQESRAAGGGRVVYRSAETKPEAWLKKTAAAGLRAEVRKPEGPFELLPNTREAIHYESIRRGELAHGLLAEIEFVEDGWELAMGAAVDKLTALTGEAVEIAEVGRALAKRLPGSPVAVLFQPRPGRRVWREFVVCDAAGRAFRMDRVVVDEDGVYVIDFKTGTEPGRAGGGGARCDEDRDQVRAYVALLRDIYPGRPIRGLLAYVDQSVWEFVEDGGRS